MAESLNQTIQTALEDLKAEDLVMLDVREISDVTDWMVVCTGTSSRHIKSLANNVVVECKKTGEAPIGVEGEQSNEWVLVDFGDVVVHVMTATAREFYDLEKLWSTPPASRQLNQE